MNTDQPTTKAAQGQNVRTKAERKAERLSWAIWAAGVYSAEKHKQSAPQTMIGVVVDAIGHIVKEA